jgi:hypothetical protein
MLMVNKLFSGSVPLLGNLEGSKMQVTPLELGLAAAAVCIVFGPKKFPGSKKITKKSESVDLSSLAPSQHAAGRAPSPLSLRDASPVFVPEETHAMADTDWNYKQPSKLPYEF